MKVDKHMEHGNINMEVLRKYSMEYITLDIYDWKEQET